jgi:hypothetical protein
VILRVTTSTGRFSLSSYPERLHEGDERSPRSRYVNTLRMILLVLIDECDGWVKSLESEFRVQNKNVPTNSFQRLMRLIQ